MKSTSKTVEGYLESLPPKREEIISSLRSVILSNLPKGYEEVMNWGMITYQVPLSAYPDTYNKKPLMYAALASQKNYISLYLTTIYMSEEKRKNFETAYKSTGKKYNAGKSCIRFKEPKDIPFALIAKAISSYNMNEFIKKVKALKKH